MGTLWTPSGEHRPEPDPRPSGGERPAAGSDPSAGPVELGPDELAAMREMHAELRRTPAADVVANHAVGLVQLALIHLGMATPPDEQGRVPPPDLAAAGVAIDACAAIADALGPRLGAHEGPLREAIAQVQLAYARVADALDRDDRPAPDA